MKKRFTTGVMGVMTALALVGASTASAATEFGSHCTANQAENEKAYALVQLSQGGAPTAAPVSGVVTSWKTRVIAELPISIAQQLEVFRPTANPAQFQVVGESAIGNVVGGENTFPTRIPIQAGDHIGLFADGLVGALYCASPETESPGNSIGRIDGHPAPGSTATLEGPVEEALVPVAAVIEPDADGDGYGDETQDKCPQNPAVQGACPVPSPPVTLSTSSVAKKSLVTVLVTANAQAPVTVGGTVKLGKGKAAKLNGGTQIVVPGAIAKFTLLFPQKLKAKLQQLSPKRFLTLALSIAAPNSAGAITTSELNVKLKGQAKPKPKKHKKPKHQA